MIPPQSITFFIDRCLGKKSIPETLRTAGVTIEIHDDHFDKGALDVDWLPQVGEKGWIVLTKDDRISKNQLERIKIYTNKQNMNYNIRKLNTDNYLR